MAMAGRLLRTIPPIPRITCLEGALFQMPRFDIPHHYTEYKATQPDHVARRLSQTDIAILQVLPVTAADIARCPSLKMIAVSGVGTDDIDLAACRQRGITVCNLPSSSTESVTEHAIAQYFAVKRKIMEVHNKTIQGVVWSERLSTYQIPPRICREEILGVIGVGELGSNVAKVASALGMRVLQAERKGVSPLKTRLSRVPFEDVLRQSTVIILTCPLTETTRRMIGEAELQCMRRDAILINVARGAIVDEHALTRALREGWIQGAATDVFEDEPLSSNSSPLLDQSNPVPNLLLSPHLAWYAGRSIKNMQDSLKCNVEAFWRGAPQNVVC